MSSYKSENEYSPNLEPFRERFDPKNIAHLHHVRHPPDMPEDTEEDRIPQHVGALQPWDLNCLCDSPAKKTALDAGPTFVQSSTGARESSSLNIGTDDMIWRYCPKCQLKPEIHQHDPQFTSHHKSPRLVSRIDVQPASPNPDALGLSDMKSSTLAKRQCLQAYPSESSRLDHYDDSATSQPKTSPEEGQDEQGRDEPGGDEPDYYASRDFD